MPIGVPRIIYCWGEELPAQWTDIYNFIFRRRMIFLMQYLDDELCNQICGLLINIHMEDRSKELEKKEMEKSGLFKGSTKSGTSSGSLQSGLSANQASMFNRGEGNANAKKSSSLSRSGFTQTKSAIDDLLTSEEDLAIDENYTLEQYTLQKITMDWLNWTANFFDYADEPYLFYLAEILSKDFTQTNVNLLYSTEMSRFMKIFKTMAFATSEMNKRGNQINSNSLANKGSSYNPSLESALSSEKNQISIPAYGDVYSPFRFLANFNSGNYSLKKLKQSLSIDKQKELHSSLGSDEKTSTAKTSNKVSEQDSTALNSIQKDINKNTVLSKLVHQLKQVQQYSKTNKEKINKKSLILSSAAEKQFSFVLENHKNQIKSSEKLLGQRTLKQQYRQDKLTSLSLGASTSGKFSKKNSQLNLESSQSSLLNLHSVTTKVPNKQYSGTLSGNAKEYSLSSRKSLQNQTSRIRDNVSSKALINDSRDFYRKQTERLLQEEESKKVFVIINSFGGSVGNGITVHDALQFIKAGSLTLALGVAASAASLALAGGTIGERYVTEGCHVMLHQPESSIQGQASDIWIDSAEIMKIRLDVAEIYSLSTYRPRHKILRDLDRDFYLTASEAVYYGLADEIATNEVMHEIIDMTNKVWEYHDSKQQRFLESRESANSGADLQTQN